MNETYSQKNNWLKEIFENKMGNQNVQKWVKFYLNLKKNDIKLKRRD